MTSIDEQIQQYLDSVYAEIDDPETVKLMEETAAFAREHQVIPDARPINLWGFGEGMQLFSEPDGGWWMSLVSIEEATGIPYSRLVEIFDEEHEERADVSTGFMWTASGAPWRLVTHDFVMRAFACHSPWHKEFYENTRELLAHGIEKSGLFEPREGGPEYVAVVEMMTVDGKPLRMSLPVERFDDEVPMVRAPWDDAEPNELIPVTSMSVTYTLERYGDSARNFLGPRVDEDEAVRLAFRGLIVPGEAS